MAVLLTMADLAFVVRKICFPEGMEETRVVAQTQYDTLKSFVVKVLLLQCLTQVRSWLIQDAAREKFTICQKKYAVVGISDKGCSEIIDAVVKK